MSKPRYSLLGAFLIGALIISVIGLAMFFGGNLGSDKTRAVMVFRGNVTGLEIGTPVQFRGMKIGEVKRVRTIYQPDSKQVLFPVYAEFTGKIEIPGYDKLANSDGVRAAWISGMVERGLRAQLQTKSFVTGQQMIMLDFVDDNEAVYSKIEGDLLEIPTVRSPNEALVDTVRELPVREIVVQAQGLLSNMNKLMAGEGGKPGVLPQTLAQFAQTAKALETRLPLLTTELQSTTREIRETLAGARTAMDGLNKTAAMIAQRTDSLGAQLDTGVRDFSSLTQRAQTSLSQFDRSLGRIEQSLGRMDSSLAQLDFALSEDAPLGSGLNQTMRQIEAASRSLRFMSDALQRQPNSLVFGAPVEKP